MHRPCALLYCHLQLVRIYHNFHTLFHIRQVFWKKDLFCKKCVLIFCAKFRWAFLVLRRNRRDITINAQTASYKVTAILIRFYEPLIFATIIHLSNRFFNSCRRLPETNHHFSLLLHWFWSKFLVVMAACTLWSTFILDLLFSFFPALSNS